MLQLGYHSVSGRSRIRAGPCSAHEAVPPLAVWGGTGRGPSELVAAVLCQHAEALLRGMISALL